jgi:hypothetical protein
MQEIKIEHLIDSLKSNTKTDAGAAKLGYAITSAHSYCLHGC